MKVYMCSFEDLTDEEASEVPNNGSGKEDANYIVVDGFGPRKIFSDAMEPEDAIFTRDLNGLYQLLCDIASSMSE